MKLLSPRLTVGLLCVSMLQMQLAQAAKESKDSVDVRAYVNDTCIVGDEPFFVPVAPTQAAQGQDNAKFLPLLGLVIGKLAELFINHEIQSKANQYKSGVARKDTHYAVTEQTNLYRADLDPVPTLSINAKLGCMTIVAAKFKPPAINCTAAYVPKELSKDSVNLPQEKWRTTRTDDSIENPLRRANICVDGKARAVYEARFEFSSDGTAYRLKDAGYRIESLLTTDKPAMSRTTLYTLKISSPTATDQQEVISSAWVNIGTVKAGSRSEGAPGKEVAWLRVPPLTVEARRNYEEKTKVHQEVIGEIQALQRAHTRNLRQLAGMDQRIATATKDVLPGLKQERTRLAVQDQSQSAELDARNAEYKDLPRSPLEFMPVTIEIGVTETESEKKAQVALAEIVGTNSDLVASAVGNAATGLLSKSAAGGDLKTEPDAGELAGDLEQARAGYYDAFISDRSAESGAAKQASQDKLLTARARYNDARRALGLEQID
jgi:hypothetical protein